MTNTILPWTSSNNFRNLPCFINITWQYLFMNSWISLQKIYIKLPCFRKDNCIKLPCDKKRKNYQICLDIENKKCIPKIAIWPVHFPLNLPYFSKRNIFEFFQVFHNLPCHFTKTNAMFFRTFSRNFAMDRS